jgi:hypothetical protein
MEVVEQGKLGFHKANLAGTGHHRRAARSHELGACPTAARPSELDLFVLTRSPEGCTSATPTTRRPATALFGWLDKIKVS